MWPPWAFPGPLAVAPLIRTAPERSENRAVVRNIEAPEDRGFSNRQDSQTHWQMPVLVLTPEQIGRDLLNGQESTGIVCRGCEAFGRRETRCEFKAPMPSLFPFEAGRN